MPVKAALLCVAACLAGPLAAGPFDGIYRPDYPWATSWDCQSIGKDGGALAVQDDVLTGVNNVCRLTNPEPVTGLDAILYDGECTGEDGANAMRILLMRLPDGIAVLADGSVSELRSCR